MGCSDALTDSSPTDSESVTKSQAVSASQGVTRHTATTKDRKDISYRVVGSGSRDIVLVHGWMVSGTVFDDLIPELRSSDYRLIIPDLRGTGPSAKPNGGYEIQNYVKDVLAVADDAGAGSFILAGHSMGGAIAQKIAGQRPNRVDGLVLMSPVPASGFALPDSIYNFFVAAADSSFVQRQVIYASSVDMDTEDVDRLVQSASAMKPKAIRQSLDAWVEADFADILSNVTAPTLMVVSDDPFMNPAFLRQTIGSKIADSRVTYFPGAGHYLFVEKPSATADKLDSFISGLP